MKQGRTNNHLRTQSPLRDEYKQLLKTSCKELLTDCRSFTKENLFTALSWFLGDRSPQQYAHGKTNLTQAFDQLIQVLSCKSTGQYSEANQHTAAANTHFGSVWENLTKAMLTYSGVKTARDDMSSLGKAFAALRKAFEGRHCLLNDKIRGHLDSCEVILNQTRNERMHEGAAVLMGSVSGNSNPALDITLISDMEDTNRRSLAFIFVVAMMAWQVRNSTGGVVMKSDIPCSVSILKGETVVRSDLSVVAGIPLKWNLRTNNNETTCDYTFKCSYTDQRADIHQLSRTLTITKDEYQILIIDWERNAITLTGENASPAPAPHVAPPRQETASKRQTPVPSASPFALDPLISGFSAPEAIDYLGGRYSGGTSPSGKPQGVGSFLSGTGMRFSGQFEEGVPVGEFIVEGDGYQYRGTIGQDLSRPGFNRGSLKVSSNGHTYIYEGRFEETGTCCVEGMLYADRVSEETLIYAGTFKPTSTGSPIPEMTGKGKRYLPEGYCYVGFLRTGLPHGKGFLIKPNAEEVSYGNWVNGTPLFDVDKIPEQYLDGDCAATISFEGIDLFRLEKDSYGWVVKFEEIPALTARIDAGLTYPVCYHPVENGIGYYSFYAYPCGRARRKKDGLWGYVNMDEKWKIAPAFNDCTEFSNNVAMVKRHDKWGMIDLSGNELIPCLFGVLKSFDYGKAIVRCQGKELTVDSKWDPLSLITNSDTQLAPKKMSNGKWGYMDLHGNMMVKGLYDEVRPFSQGMAAIKQDGYWGYINGNNKVVIQPQYRQADQFKSGRAMVEVNGRKLGFIDCLGTMVIEPIYSSVYAFWGDESAVCKEGKWGVIDKNGKMVLPFVFDDVTNVSNPTNGQHPTYEVVYKGKHISVNYQWKEPVMERPTAPKPPEKAPLSPVVYDEQKAFSYGRAAVRRGKKWGYIDESRYEAIPLIYDFAGRFMGGKACVMLNGKKGLIDVNGQIILEISYDQIMDFTDNLWFVENYGNWGLVDQTDLLIPYLFDKICNTSREKETAEVVYECETITIDRNWTLAKFNSMWRTYRNGLKIGFRKGGLITGEKIYAKYDATTGHFYNGVVFVKLGGRWGMIDEEGDTVLPFVFEEVVFPWPDGSARVKYNGETIDVDRYWKEPTSGKLLRNTKDFFSK
ncbi:WG repeat-containing protein [Parabacteroides sp.]|uniref:WG repeat-containing protein n=1 Tax=Parabacteroides sp. TaxID=1869337 RepID=UPI00257DB4E0|nr:WG repeat-containing protein [Parabacteroides sp.]